MDLLPEAWRLVSSRHCTLRFENIPFAWSPRTFWALKKKKHKYLLATTCKHIVAPGVNAQLWRFPVYLFAWLSVQLIWPSRVEHRVNISLIFVSPLTVHRLTQSRPANIYRNQTNKWKRKKFSRMKLVEQAYEAALIKISIN